MNSLTVENSILLTLLISCLYTDLKARKIPNKITITAIIMGIVSNTYNNGILGMAFSVKGLVVGFLLLIIPFVIGGLGGGDVKLIMAIGAIMGDYFVIQSIIYTGIVGAIIALVLMIRYKRFNKLKKVKEYLLSTVLLQKIQTIEDEEQPLYFPYGIAITIGTLIAFFINQ